MAESTLTASLAQSTTQPRAVHAGQNVVSGSFNWSADKGATANTTAVVNLARIPTNATLVDIIHFHSSGAASAPVSIGYDDGTTRTLSAFVSVATEGAVARPTIGVPKTFTAVSGTQAVTIVAKYAVGTATASLRAKYSITYNDQGDEVSI